jgi:hypothetical protein
MPSSGIRASSAGCNDSGADRHAGPLRSPFFCDRRRSGGGVSYSTVTVALKVFSGATLSHGRA